jgi:hypothetical protein
MIDCASHDTFFQRIRGYFKEWERRYTTRSGQLGFGQNILAERLPLAVQGAYGRPASCDRSSSAGTGVAHQNAPDGPAGQRAGESIPRHMVRSKSLRARGPEL